MSVIDKRKIGFEEIEIPQKYGHQFWKVYFIVTNGDSEVTQYFDKLQTSIQKIVKDLIALMASYNGYYKSERIDWRLKKYNYGELRQFPHRFFFFISCGKNLIFFKCILKKKEDIPDIVYNRINKKKEVYEQAFRQFIKTH